MDKSEDITTAVETPISARVVALEARCERLERELALHKADEGDTKIDAGPIHMSGSGRWLAVIVVSIVAVYLAAKGSLASLWALVSGK